MLAYIITGKLFINNKICVLQNYDSLQELVVNVRRLFYLSREVSQRLVHPHQTQLFLGRKGGRVYGVAEVRALASGNGYHYPRRKVFMGIFQRLLPRSSSPESLDPTKDRSGINPSPPKNNRTGILICQNGPMQCYTPLHSSQFHGIVPIHNTSFIIFRIGTSSRQISESDTKEFTNQDASEIFLLTTAEGGMSQMAIASQICRERLAYSLLRH